MAATRVTVLNDGSLRVEGDFELVDQAGTPFGLCGRTRITLCRCGQSARKPFCDSTHKTCGFDSTVVAFDLEPPVAKSPAPAAGHVKPPTGPASAT